MTTQAKAAIYRQIGGVLVTVLTVLGAKFGHDNLPAVIQAVLTATGPLIIAIEHSNATAAKEAVAPVVQAVENVPEVGTLLARAKADLDTYVQDALKLIGQSVPAPPPAPDTLATAQAKIEATKAAGTTPWL